MAVRDGRKLSACGVKITSPKRIATLAFADSTSPMNVARFRNISPRFSTSMVLYHCGGQMNNNKMLALVEYTARSLYREVYKYKSAGRVRSRGRGEL
ncbi:hypothetical protein U1Q18_049367, partial [Sarracenia purpurea var. burkii]